MKKILLLGILLSSITNTYAQLVTPPYFGVFTRVEGQSSFGNNYNTMLSTTGIEVFLGRKLYFYGQLYFQYDLMRDNYYVDEIMVTSPYAFGNLIGMGGYLFDKRSSLGTGWSMVMNGGVGMRIYDASDNQPDPDPMFPVLGGFTRAMSLWASFIFEINTSVRYHVSQNFGLQFGAVVGLDYIAPRRDDLALRYGASFGIVF